MKPCRSKHNRLERKWLFNNFENSLSKGQILIANYCIAVKSTISICPFGTFLIPSDAASDILHVYDNGGLRAWNNKVFLMNALTASCIPQLPSHFSQDESSVMMDPTSRKQFPPQASLSETDLGRAAAEFLASSIERRKRGRTLSGNGAEYVRKRSNGQPVDMDIARKSLRSLIHDSPSFQQLVRFEEHLDLSIMRKQQAINEATKMDSHCESRIFRLYIFNSYRSQPGGEGVTAEDVPSWSLRIQGKLLPKGEGNSGGNTSLLNNQSTPGLNGKGGTPSTSSMGLQTSGTSAGEADTLSEVPSVIAGAVPRCSDVFSKIVVELDKDVYPINNTVEWTRNDREPASDGFEISRAGSQELTARVFLYVDHRPPRFRTSAELFQLIGIESETRSAVFAYILQYVKKHQLQSSENLTTVRLDAGLKSLLRLGNQQVEAAQVVQLKQLFAVVKSHLAPLEPLVIEYDMKLSGDIVDNQDCYDIPVNVANMSVFESGRKTGAFGRSVPNSPEFDVLCERHMAALEKIAHHKKRREFLQKFCANPVQFINHLILNQTRNMKVRGGQGSHTPDEDLYTGLYQEEWVHEAVPRYLLRKAIADTAEDTAENSLKS